MDLEFATAGELTQAIARREVSSRELLEHLLSRAAQVNPAVNAVVATDVERARAAAAAADQATARAAGSGERLAPLHGLPMTVKDTWQTAGLITTSGAPRLAQFVPEADATCIARLRQAGAIIFGKSNTPMYAGDWQTYNDVYGRTSNPWDVTRTVGGSSGGAAAAVAAGLTPLEFGSDIGGSIRNPAHFTGVYGLKPSWGVVPVRGHIPGPPGSLLTADVGVAGPIARCVGDLRTALGVVAGPLPEDAGAWRLDLTSGPDIGNVRQLRVATIFDDGADVTPISRDVRNCLDSFAGQLSDAGATVETAKLPVALADGLRTWTQIVMPIIGADLPDETYAAMAALETAGSADSQALAGAALASRFRDVMRATERRQVQRVAWAQFFRQYDVVLAPVMPVAAFPHDTDRPLAERFLDVDGTAVPHAAAAAWLCAIGVALLPALALPVGLGESGLPVGVQIVGPYLTDMRLLRIAELIDEAVGPGFARPPG
ncbi:MAG TPA: amidase family protein [Streptosporangiaceae bacterium]